MGRLGAVIKLEAADALRERALELYDGPEPSHDLWKELT